MRAVPVEVLLPEVAAPFAPEVVGGLGPAALQRSSPVRSNMTAATSIVPGDPQLKSSVGLPAFPRTTSSSCSSCQAAGASVCATRRIPASPIQSDGTTPTSGKSGSARYRSGSVSATSPQSRRVSRDRPVEGVQRPDHPGRAEVERRDPFERRLVILLIERMRGPEAVRVERRLRLGDDPRHGGTGAIRVPGGVRDRLVRVRVDQLAEVGHAAHRRQTNTYSELASSKGSPANPPSSASSSRPATSMRPSHSFLVAHQSELREPPSRSMSTRFDPTV